MVVRFWWFWLFLILLVVFCKFIREERRYYGRDHVEPEANAEKVVPAKPDPNRELGAWDKNSPKASNYDAWR